MMWSGKYQTGPDCFFKSWTFVGWLFHNFQNGSYFYQGPSAPNWKSYLESSQNIPYAFYHYSNHKLKIYGSIRKMSHKISLLVELLKFFVDIFIMKQFFNSVWYSWFIPHWLICSCIDILVKLTKFEWMDWSEKWYQIMDQFWKFLTVIWFDCLTA